jgi:hypothetical protein
LSDVEKRRAKKRGISEEAYLVAKRAVLSPEDEDEGDVEIVKE